MWRDVAIGGVVVALLGCVALGVMLARRWRKELGAARAYRAHLESVAAAYAALQASTSSAAEQRQQQVVTVVQGDLVGDLRDDRSVTHRGSGLFVPVSVRGGRDRGRPHPQEALSEPDYRELPVGLDDVRPSLSGGESDGVGDDDGGSRHARSFRALLRPRELGGGCGA